MKIESKMERSYQLLTPGPLTTSDGVKKAMLRDSCTWDRDYNDVVQIIRNKMVALAGENTQDYTAVLMQGSGTFSVESVIGTAVPRKGKLLVLINGAYGQRIREIARRLPIRSTQLDFGETTAVDPKQVEEKLRQESGITHVAIVHTETTTGMLNPVKEVGEVVKRYGKTYIVDAMSSFGGIQMDVKKWGIDFLITSSNKCIQGVPGFGVVIACKKTLATCEGRSISLSLDLYDQWVTMEAQQGKWRYTSPTHTVLAFHQALLELEQEGGVKSRQERYQQNQHMLVRKMEKIGFQVLLPEENRSPIITSFLYPDSPRFSFDEFYQRLKDAGYVIYPGKVTTAETFRIGNIGDVYPEDMEKLVQKIAEIRFW